VGLEIEFEYEDTQGGAWSRPEESDLRGRIGRRWNERLSAGSPLFVQLGIAVAALVLGAASTAGFLAGRTAQQDRATLRLHLGPVDPYVIVPIPLPADQSPAQRLATPWTDTFDQPVMLTLVNDGPDPVSLLGATLTAPQFRTLTLTAGSAGSAQLAPGGISVLRGRAHIVCGDYPALTIADALAAPQVATVAQISVRTADGETRRETLQVDRYSDVAEQAVCQRMLGAEVVGTPVYTASPTAGVYTVTVPVTNRAPFPLRASVSSSAIEEWQVNAGLDLKTAGPVTIPARGTWSLSIVVTVVDCTYAKAIAVEGYGFNTLSFTDARNSPDSLDARQQDEALFMADHGLIVQYCDRSGH
jgi:hypothetical protein